MTEPSQAHIDRARELGLSFDPSDTSDEELSRAIATYERVKRYGRVIHRETFWRRKSAEKQCIAWKRLYDAVVLPPPQS
ncbi:hypothetical protein [Mycobacteroides abscessus]|uniref:hypothetical protein n=1 Tax=Mycobacteroides abscessus TaxID=36809 RepID=UPI0028BE8A49|nr:hypothetical protein [Mycobacteroides abscessus]